MRSTVFDTRLVASANGDIRARRPGNILDCRLILLEQAVARVTTTLVNKKLLKEYNSKIPQSGIRNDSVRSFIEFVIDHGVDSGRSTLSHSDYVKAHEARWPTHDHHLIAAAIGHNHVTIFVTEQNHFVCTREIHRRFGITIRKS